MSKITVQNLTFAVLLASLTENQIATVTQVTDPISGTLVEGAYYLTPLSRNRADAVRIRKNVMSCEDYNTYVADVKEFAGSFTVLVSERSKVASNVESATSTREPVTVNNTSGRSEAAYFLHTMQELVNKAKIVDEKINIGKRSFNIAEFKKFASDENNIRTGTARNNSGRKKSQDTSIVPAE